MDRLRLCLETLRRLAKETEDPNCVVLAEREINDYLQNEIDALRAALERLSKAIDEEARKGQGEDWSLMVGHTAPPAARRLFLANMADGSLAPTGFYAYVVGQNCLFCCSLVR